MVIARNTAAILALVTLTSCATSQQRSGEDGLAEALEATASISTSAAERPAVDASAPLSTSARDLANSAEEEERAQPVIYRGNDRQVRTAPLDAPVRFVGEDVSLNFEQAPLSEVVHAIVGDILGLDYIVDHPIQGQVTLRSRTPIPRDELLGVLESLLKANNALMMRGDDNRYLITGTDRGRNLRPNLSNPNNTNAGYSTVVIPLQYVSASAMAEILKPLAEESAFVRIDNSRNLLMLAGTRSQMDGWMDIISTFDVDMLKGMSVGMFPLENSEVEEVSEVITQLLEGGEGSKTGIKGLVRVIPFRRLNSVLVVTPRSHYLDTVGQWIERMDVSPDSSYEKQLFVYPVQNTSASRLAEVLTQIYSGGAAATGGGYGGGSQQYDSSSGFSDQGGVAPGMSPETLGSSSSSSLGSNGGGSGISAGSAFGSNDDSERGKMVSGSLGAATANARSPISDVRVVADEENNSLMIYATGRQYKIIRKALDKIDTVATQIIIEASILEVTLTDSLRYGLEWTFKAGIGNDYDATGLLANTENAIGPISPGFSYTVRNSANNISAVLNALSKESLLNVISTPSVMVLDNHTAYIHVGNQVPVIDQLSTSDASDTGRITQSITYRDTGVKLSVRPSVNAGGLVTMDVEQSVTDVGEIDPASGQRAFLERNIMSRVAVRSNESVVLGGLIRENATNSDQGVPFLHKIPLIGPIFGTVSSEDTRTELLVIITPRALYDETELRAVSDEMRSRIRHMELIDAPDK